MNEEYIIPSLTPDYLFWVGVIIAIVVIFTVASKGAQPTEL